MNETVIDGQQGIIHKRPVFLTILCILSFIGSGIWAVISLFTLAMPEKVLRIMFGIIKEQQGPKTEELLDPMQAEMVRQMEEAFLANFIELSKMYVIAGAAISLVLALTAILGVAKMWQLRRTGFWIYSVANILSVGAMIYSEIWLGIPFALLFIILYAFNLKHLK
jgi:hypothetical protein